MPDKMPILKPLEGVFKLYAEVIGRAEAGNK